jgi:hypothetical protein
MRRITDRVYIVQYSWSLSARNHDMVSESIIDTIWRILPSSVMSPLLISIKKGGILVAASFGLVEVGALYD